MNNGKLMSHVDTDLVTRDQLRTIASPEATPTFHPIPHGDLVEQLDLVLAKSQIYIREERFALRRDGSVLFGVFELDYGDCSEGRAAWGSARPTTKRWPFKSAPAFPYSSVTTSPSAAT